MSLPPEDPKSYIIRVNAAKMGCALCGAQGLRIPPAGDPFSSGPYQGRYWCADCWTLYYDEHPVHLADIETRQFVSEEAKQIRLDRLRKGAELVYEDGDNRIFLTERGTLLIDLKGTVPLQPCEYDPEKFGALLRAIQGVQGKIPGYEAIPA